MFSTHQSQVHSYIAGRDVKSMTNFKDVSKFMDLRRLGIRFGKHDNVSMDTVQNMAANVNKFRASIGMDALQPTVTQGSIGTPIQFLQEWLPGFVFVMTAARNIDIFIGVATVGSWEDEQVVQGILERTGFAVPYGDYANVPMASWNTNFPFRTVVRFEQGMMIGNLEAARAGRMNVDDSGMKREAAAMQLEIARNNVGFNGYNSGANNTYGFLNDPGLPSYVTVATGAASSTLWSTKTFLEICKDIRTGIVALRTNSLDVINPEEVDITLAVATAAVDWLSTTSDFGISVREWLKEAYPRVRVVSAPQLNSAHSSANVFYLYADQVKDMSTDGGRVWIQPVPAKFMVTGVQQLAKGYIEDYTNATAGAMCKRPWAVVRYFGI